MKKRPSVNYINNEEFCNRLTEWKNSGEEKIPDDIALSLMKICDGMAKSGRFASYTWKDEMIGDALYSCIRFVRNFDPEKSKNAFAFFSQIAFHAFVKRIGLEKQRLAAMEEYKEHISMIYDLQDVESDDVDNKYGIIENTAKRINRTYAKEQKKRKQYKPQPAKEIDEFF